MREIRFRAKPCYTGANKPNWVYGTFNYLAERVITPGATDNGTITARCDKGIITDIGRLDVEVLCDTVCQYTGMLDNKGTRIYEGDILQNGNGYFYVVEWREDFSGFLGKQVGSSSYIGIYNWRQNMHIVGNRFDNPELLAPKPVKEEEPDRYTLLPGEFRIKGACNNGCMCQPGVLYVAKRLTKEDGRGKNGKLRVWAFGSYVKDGKRSGYYCDWDADALSSYEVLFEDLTREEYKEYEKKFMNNQGK